jgi:hypothetical protein
MQLTANELTWETGSLGSNPSLSVLISIRTFALLSLSTRVRILLCGGEEIKWSKASGNFIQ